LKNFYLKPKLFDTLKGYGSAQLTKDIIAGIIVAIIALPLSIALALASGVEPACGVYTAVAAGFMVSFLGGSRVQIAGPTAAFATIVAGIVATQGMDGLIIATLLAGVLLILMGIFKLGALIKFIPTTITVGFTSGIAVTILVGQIKDFLGLKYAEGVKPIETLEKLEANWEAIATFSLPALVIGLISLAILIIYPKFEKKIPPSLIAVIVGALLVKFIPWFDQGVYTIGELYTIPSGLPPFTLGGIDLSLERIIALLPDAATIALLAAIESLLSCVVADTMVNDKHNSNAELVAQGVGNVFSVAFGGIPATGAIARTAANAKNGGRTPVAGMVHAVVLLLVLLVLMPYAGLIPMPTIAAILFIVAYNMSEWRKFKKIVRSSPRSDTLVMVVTFALTVIFDLVVAIAAGLILTAVLFLRRMSRETRLEQWMGDPEKGGLPAGVEVYDIKGELFFGASDKISGLTFDETDRCMILRMGSVSSLDATALNALENLARKAQSAGVRFCVTHVNPQPMKVLKKSGFDKLIGEENIFEHIGQILEQYK